MAASALFIVATQREQCGRATVPGGGALIHVKARRASLLSDANIFMLRHLGDRIAMAADRRRALSAEDYADGVLAGDRAMLGRAITLIESGKGEHAGAAQDLLQRLLPHTGKAHRIGITGVPGVGKSTAIDQLGMNLVEQGHRVAVLAIDPTSTRTGGSILGDKTRMTRLAQSREAFIRPSPTSGTLGGVARKTRETIALVEAAGFDVVIVETVGVGQSEVAVGGMVDFFLVLLLAGGGDDLQGIKRGIVEMADMIAITKSDGDNVVRARRAASVYQSALAILTPGSPNWTAPVLTISAGENRGLDELWAKIEEHKARMTASGEFLARRGNQAVDWMRDLLQERLLGALQANAATAHRMAELEGEVRAGTRTPALAVGELVGMMGLGAPQIDGGIA
jgi:LAO/AO transport system kinase